MIRAADTEQADKHWTLDRKIPLVFVLAIFAQTFGFGWWGSSMAARVDALEQAQKESKMIVGPQSDRLTRLEVKLENITETLAEIKLLLRRQP